MNTFFPKISFAAGFCLIAASMAPAFSQCNSGYQDWGYSDYYVPSSSPSALSYGAYDPCVPGCSGDYDYGSSGICDQYYYSFGMPAYDIDVTRQSECSRANCFDSNRTVSGVLPHGEIESRLRYVEKILSYIMSFLGFGDGFESGDEGFTPYSGRSIPDCSGGT